jgi:thiamine-phosphate pyrophosphorylase
MKPTAEAAVRGLYAVTPDEADTEVLLANVRRALQGGAKLIQYRNKTADAPTRRAQAGALALLCREHGAPLIVNDHLHLALEIDAAGVHLGAEDGDIAAARRALGPRRLLGASCYNRYELAVAAREAGADHVGFGAAFPSSTKQAAARAPLELYRRARAELGLPVVAIGGISPDNAPIVIAAGADAVAVISALFTAPDIAAAAARFASLFPMDPS